MKCSRQSNNRVLQRDATYEQADTRNNETRKRPEAQIRMTKLSPRTQVNSTEAAIDNSPVHEPQTTTCARGQCTCITPQQKRHQDTIHRQEKDGCYRRQTLPTAHTTTLEALGQPCSANKHAQTQQRCGNAAAAAGGGGWCEGKRAVDTSMLWGTAAPRARCIPAARQNSCTYARKIVRSPVQRATHS